MSSKMHNGELVKLAKTFRVAESETDLVIFDFFSALDTPRSLACWILYNNQEYQQLVELEVLPKHYDSPFRFRDDYAATHFLSKSSFLKLDVSKKAKALSKFFDFEELCSRTNRRFKLLHLDPLFNGPNVWLLNATIRKIASILGDFSPEEFVDEANWGPGVTTLLKGSHISAVNKFHCENGITHDLHTLVEPWFSTAYPAWSSHLASHNSQMFSIQKGNVIVTVPKNSKTDRVIAVEPGLNLWFQKGVGSMIRRRLQRSGIDLNSQVRNQQLARLSSKDGKLATIDFSSASDSISTEVVRELLPPRWFALLDSMRSKIGIHDKKPIRWEKFSSMGNGFTFELESLIFFAAAQAVAEYLQINGEISVFGDDVIIPVECYETFSLFSEFLGFQVNQQKSFSTGDFRESCGAHYYSGIDCKPIFLKERLQNVQSVYKLANSLRMLGHRRNSYCGCDSRFRGLWNRLKRRVPEPLRLFIPKGIGDCGFIGNFDEATPSLARHGIEGFLVRALVETGVNQYFEETGLLLARLRVTHTPFTIFKAHKALKWYEETGISSVRKQLDQEYGNNYTLKGRTKTHVAKVLVPRWCDVGGWL